MRAIFLGLCPNCGQAISDSRLMAGCVCDRCLEESVEVNSFEDVEKIYNSLKKERKLQAYREFYSFLREVRDAELAFQECFGFKMWQAQRTWMKRLLQGRSFSIIASTGMGKTTFGLFAACYLFKKEGKKSYLLFPTSTLLQQVFKKIGEIAKKMGIDAKILAYLGNQKEKDETKRRILEGDFDILLSTSQFLAKNFILFNNKNFDFIFIDDVDAFLKSSRNIEKVLLLLGFESQDIEKAYEESPKENEIRDHGILIIASATGRARGKKMKLYRNLLNFDVGYTRESFRNIYDCFEIGLNKGKLLELVKVCGKGGLIFTRSIEEAREITNFLKQNEVKAEMVVTTCKKALEDFGERKIDLLVGVATYYGLLVRGLDLPHLIRYAIFYGVPRLTFSMEMKKCSEIIAMLNLLDEIIGKEVEKVRTYYFNLIKILRTSSAFQVKKINEALQTGSARSPRERLFLEARDFVMKLLQNDEVREKLKNYRYATIEEDEKIKVSIADAKTYIQASGRTSRLYAGGISRGLSILLVDDEKLLASLQRFAKFFADVRLEKVEKEKILRVLQEIDVDRKKILQLMSGEVFEGKDLVRSAVMIVESPNKAKTIANFFGKPSRRKIGKALAYEVNTGNYLLTIIATLGHIFDLSSRKGIDGILILGKNFIPVYASIKTCSKCNESFTDTKKCAICGSDLVDKMEIVNSIIETCKEAEEVFIATDPDTEGEKIAYDIMLAIRPYCWKIFRVEFHEVTRRAVEEAIKNRRTLNLKLVESQIVRRIEDRWLGFGLSRILWRRFKNKRLSAGRVQTPVLTWIIDRAEEYEKRKSRYTYCLLENGAKLWVRGGIRGNKVVLIDREVKEKRLPPPPPYTTDTLLKDASRLLKLHTSETMRLAQDLFELALITYHRTDSPRVSDVGIEIAKDWITSEVGKEFFVPRKYGKEGAHECIRPTRAIDTARLTKMIKEGSLSLVKPITTNHLRLYDLIFRRFISSQMEEAVVTEQKIRLRVDGEEIEEEGIVKIGMPGWVSVFGFVKRIPSFDKKMFKIVRKRYVIASDVKLFTEGDIIAEMKEKQIGRPSTYAKIVSTLFERKYIFRKKAYIIPTLLGRKVCNFLNKAYSGLVSEKRTRKLEHEMRLIEKGEIDWQKILHEIFQELKRFHIIPK